MESALERREQIAEMLRQRKKDTVSNLAVEFGVCDRTIRYDLMAISLSYPISTAKGCGGGVTWEGKRPVGVLSEREIAAIRNVIKYATPDDTAVLERLIEYAEREPFDVGDIFKILETGITQIELADKLGVEKSTLTNYMTGHRRPRAETVKRIQKIKKEIGI